jgi:hypothetical protein
MTVIETAMEVIPAERLERLFSGSAAETESAAREGGHGVSPVRSSELFCAANAPTER